MCDASTFCMVSGSNSMTFLEGQGHLESMFLMRITESKFLMRITGVMV